MTDHRIAWAMLACAGVLANVRTLAVALARRRRLRESGRNGALCVIARQAVRSECVTLLVQCLLASLAGAACYFDEPVLKGARAFFVLCGWALTACSLALAADSVLDLWDRRRLVGLVAAASQPVGPVVAGTGDTVGEDQADHPGSSGTSL